MPGQYVLIVVDEHGNPYELIVPEGQTVRVALTKCCGRRDSRCDCPDGPRYV